VGGDASFGGNLVIGKNITILGDLTVQEYTNSAIINTVTTNVFNISEDLSLNGRIMASSDASFGGKLNVNQAATFGTTTTSTGLLTASNGFTVSTGTVTFPSASISASAIIGGVGGSNYFATDVSMASKLFVTGDASFVGNVYASGFSNTANSFGTGNIGTLTWTQASPSGFPKTGSAVCVAMSTSGQYAIAGGVGTTNFWYSSDYGRTWIKTLTSVLGQQGSAAMSSTGQYCIMTTGYGGGIWFSSNYGQTWTQSASTPGSSNLNYWGAAISPNGTYAIAGTNGSGIYYSTNSGSTWTLSTGISNTTGMNSVALASTGTAVAGSYSNIGIYYSNNNGQSWTVSSISTGNWYVAIAANGGYALACGATGIYYSTNNGQTWTVSNMSSNSWNFVSMSTTGQYCLAASGASALGIWYSTNYGQTWSQTTITSGYYYSAALSGNGQYLLVGSTNTTNNGISYATNQTISPGQFIMTSDASFNGNLVIGKVLKTSTISESFLTNTGTTSPYTFDYSTGAIFYVTTPPAANFTANFTNVPSDINRTYVATLIITATTNKKFCNSVQINGAVAITPNYAGGIPTSITSGNVITQTISIQRITAGDVAANVSVLSAVTAWY
jgi:hypothetical protein